MKSNTTRFIPLVLFISVILATLAACGGGGGSSPAPAPKPAPVVNADPTGYYDVNGTATVSGGAIVISDLEAMVHNNRLMMMSVANNLMYDIAITKISGNDFTGTATVYTDGQNPMSNVPVTGTITTGSSITGALTGTGAGNGTFSLTYASSNDQPSKISRIVNTSPPWTGPIGNVGPTDNYQFGIDNTGMLYDFNPIGQGYFRGCSMDGTVTALSNTSLYRVVVTITQCNPVKDLDGDYTGLAATQDISDKVLSLTLTKADGSYSVSGNFHH